MPHNPSTPSATAKSLTAADIDATFDCDDESPAVTLESLAALPQWLAWREEARKGKDGREEVTKVPYGPAGGSGKSTDPATWGTRAKAEARARNLSVKPGLRRGVGIVLGKLLNDSGMAVVGIDLDASRNPDTGAIAPWAAEIMAALPTYTEVSPSGTGVKLFGLVGASGLPKLLGAFGKPSGRQRYGQKWTRGAGKHGPAVEFYASARFFTVTGNGEGEWAHLRQLDPADLVALIEAENARKASPKPEGAPNTKATGDQSRSGRALALAGKLRRGGGTRDDFGEALAADSELSAWAQDARQVDRAWARAGDGLADLEGFSFDEDGVALAFAKRHRDELRFDHHAGRWFRWTGTHWQLDETKLAFAWSRNICRAMRIGDAKDPAIRALAKAAAAAAVERFAQADQTLAVTSAEWDRDSWLLGTPGGTVDLRTGTLRPAQADDRITKVAAVAPESDFDPALDCSQWLTFLAEVTSDDAGLIRFLQQWCGYCLTGSIREHALLFIYGPGGNGKSVFLNTLTGILGDYCQTAAPDTFTASKAERHPTDFAMLRGARLVCASETEEGKAWAEVRIKEATGGDPITARFMRQDFFTFRPAFKLTIVGNHKPVLNTVDDAMRRRVNVVPFETRPANPDRELEAKLREEWPGILAWMIAGCLDWQAHGLQKPGVVANATNEYFEDQDTFGRWLAEACEIGRAHVATLTALWDSWTRFACSEGESAMKRNKGFTDALRARGFRPIKDTHNIRGRGFQGLKPHASQEEEL